MSTSKKQVKSLRRSQPDRLDMIDQANMDIDFVESFLDLLCAVGEGKRLEAVRCRSIICLCSESKVRMDAIKMFVRSIPACDDSRPETAGKDMIREETAAYGRGIEGKPGWILQETIIFLTIPGAPEGTFYACLTHTPLTPEYRKNQAEELLTSTCEHPSRNLRIFFNFLCQPVPEGIRSDIKIILGLQPKPKFRGRAKKPTESERCIG